MDETAHLDGGINIVQRPSSRQSRNTRFRSDLSLDWCASRPEYKWRQALAQRLREFNDVNLHEMNRAPPPEVLSLRSSGHNVAAQLILIDRYHQGVLDGSGWNGSGASQPSGHP